ncbi:MAG: right-handed parallel beta-helix repeat-containing protein [Prevotella sp.]|nr:right-handed parallel beta-helix repeat-containing protein [Prevotella sp.]
MKSLRHLLYTLCMSFAVAAVISCDDDTFGTSPSLSLTFSTDTVRLDTLFSTVPSSTRSFWVYNKSGDGIRCATVKQERGNQSGFRVNVHGIYLGQTNGYATNEIEIRNKDSIRVYVEATLPNNYKGKPVSIEDNLVFTLESGRQQKVNLNAFAWDARIMKNVVIKEDATLATTDKPIVIYGGIDVKEGATLTIAPGTTIYFHGDGGMEISGKLICNGTQEAPITLRGDRLDNMFDYLPYDNISGQWKGIHIKEGSYDNIISHTDIHGTYDGIVADSSDVTKTKLTIENSIVHNGQGYGLMSVNSKLIINNCQLTNTLKDCLFADGGDVTVNNTTIAQFYPFDSKRGYAIHFSAANHPLLNLNCANSIITGYGNDELSGESDAESDNANEFNFSNCLIRTPKITTDDSIRFTRVEYEDVEDTIAYGAKNFKLVDGNKQRYDFRLSAKSHAIGLADKETALPCDRLGTKRDDQPDAGAYEYVEEENSLTKTNL